MVIAHAFKPLNQAPGVEALLLMVLTATGSFALYEAVRRLPWARPLFGLATRARTAGTPTPAHGQALAPR